MKVKQSIFSVTRRLSKTAVKWWRDEHADTAASLAFYSLISLVPILITGVSIASWIVGEEIAKQSLLDGTNSIAGKNVADYFAQLLSSDINWIGSGVSPIFGAVFLLYAATKVIAELRKSLGKIFGKPRHKGKKAMIAKAMNRGVAIVLLLFLGGFIACAVVVETILVVVVHSLADSRVYLKLTTYSAPIITFAAIVLLASVAMKWLPQRPPLFKHALQGGIVSAVLLLVLKIGLTVFLKYADVGNFYGSALTLVLVLFWIYFAMQAFLFGAEYAAELAREQPLPTNDDDMLELESDTKATPEDPSQLAGTELIEDKAIAEEEQKA